MALLALQTEAEIASATGTRRIPLTTLFVGPGRTSLKPDELLIAVHVPTDHRSVFCKLGKRDAVAISLVMGAASVAPDGGVAIGLGCVAPVPLRLTGAEAAIAAGGGLCEQSIEAAALSAGQEVTPIDDHRGSARYRRAMAIAITRRLLNQLAQSETPSHAGAGH